MSWHLAVDQSWKNGYYTVGWIQIGLVVVLLLSFPLWFKNSNEQQDNDNSESKPSFKRLLSIPGLKSALAVFFLYCTIEASFGLWGASYLVIVRDFEAENAAKLVSLYYIGITVGRFVSGFITSRLTNQSLVFLGQTIMALGLVVLLLPFEITLIPGFFLVGLGCAPIFPSLLHETPSNFGEKNSQAIMGMQMASAYVGITIMPLFFGKLASYVGYMSLVWFVAVVLILKIYMTLDLNKRVKIRKMDGGN